MKYLHHKAVAFVKQIVAMTKGKSRAEINEIIFKEADRRKQSKIEAKEKPKRVEPMERKNYMRFFRLVPLGFHIALRNMPI